MPAIARDFTSAWRVALHLRNIRSNVMLVYILILTLIPVIGHNWFRAHSGYTNKYGSQTSILTEYVFILLNFATELSLSLCPNVFPIFLTDYHCVETLNSFRNH